MKLLQAFTVMAIFICGACSAAQAKEPVWTPFTPDDGDYHILMPGNAENKSTDVNGNSIRKYECDLNGDTYSVSSLVIGSGSENFDN